MKLFHVVNSQFTNLLHERIDVAEGRLGSWLGCTLVNTLTGQQVHTSCTPLGCLATSVNNVTNHKLWRQGTQLYTSTSLQMNSCDPILPHYSHYKLSLSTLSFIHSFISGMHHYYKWRLNPVCHIMFYTCTHMTITDIKWLTYWLWIQQPLATKFCALRPYTVDVSMKTRRTVAPCRYVDVIYEIFPAIVVCGWVVRWTLHRFSVAHHTWVECSRRHNDPRLWTSLRTHAGNQHR